MSAVATRTGNLDRILAAVGGGGIERHGSSLVAVVRIDWPLRLVPSALEVVGYLGKAEREGRSSEKSCPSNHYCGLAFFASLAHSCQKSLIWM